MPETQPANSDAHLERRLVGWKAIARHFGKSVRSVQRWELTLGLPVHRLPEDEGAVVYADPDEIDEWRRSLAVEPASDPDDPPDETASEVAEAPVWRSHPWVTLAAAALAVFLSGVVIGWQVNRPLATATDFRLAGKTLDAVDASGALVWTYTFETDVSPFGDGRRVARTVDLDGDGEVEVIVPVRSSRAGGAASSTDAVYTFSRSGTLKWRVRPETVLTLGGDTHSGPWELVDIVIPKSAAPRRVWFAFSRAAGANAVMLQPSSPGFIIEASPLGQLHLRYAQAGLISAIGNWVTPAGAFLAISGRSPEHNHASLVLLRDDDPPATFASSDPGSAYYCANCPRGSARRILLFPPLELGRTLELPPWLSTAYEYVPQLQMQYRQGSQSTGIIEINPDFSFDSFRFSDSHWANHRRYEREGRLDHEKHSCPDLRAPMTIREWTPAAGWRDWLIRPAA